MHDINSIPHFLQLPHFYWWDHYAKTIGIYADNLEDQISTSLSDNQEDAAIALQILHGLRQLEDVAQKRADELEKPIREFNKACLQEFRNKKRSDKAVNS